MADRFKQGAGTLPSLQKRSISIAGHRTSVALEPAFWEALEALAGERPLNALMAEIDAERARATPDQPLASACRVFALAAARAGRLA
jgi:predicted DNA-binding ribbon-helix-helix protein